MVAHVLFKRLCTGGAPAQGGGAGGQGAVTGVIRAGSGAEDEGHVSRETLVKFWTSRALVTAQPPKRAFECLRPDGRDVSCRGGWEEEGGNRRAPP